MCSSRGTASRSSISFSRSSAGRGDGAPAPSPQPPRLLEGAAHRNPALRRSAGRPFLAAEIRTAPVAGSEYGEVEVRAPWTPRARITEHGRETVRDDWIPTGDLGEIRDGFIYLMDRANDVIILGGFNVYPQEVETVLNAHPAVVTSAASG